MKNYLKQNTVLIKIKQWKLQRRKPTKSSYPRKNQGTAQIWPLFHFFRNLLSILSIVPGVKAKVKSHHSHSRKRQTSAFALKDNIEKLEKGTESFI